MGAELDLTPNVEVHDSFRHLLPTSPDRPSGTRSPSLDLDCDLDYCDIRSVGSGSVATSSVVSDEETEQETEVFVDSSIIGTRIVKTTIVNF